MTSTRDKEYAPPRVMRWVYARDAERLTCELSLDETHLLYELRFLVGEPALTEIERFIHAASAFTRHCELEAEWIRNGWTLEEYASHGRDTPPNSRPSAT